MKQKIYVGTSGYAISQKLWWEIGNLNSVEINYTFYRQPKPETWEKWAQEVPKDFLYSIKVNQYITHRRRLIDFKESWKTFYTDGAKLLGKNLGPLLFQFPPSFKNNSSISTIDHKTAFERLKGIAKIIPKKVKCAFEMRDISWYTDSVYDFFKEQNWAFVNVDVTNTRKWYDNVQDGFIPKVVTADFFYFRFHGSVGKFRGDYTKAQLKTVLSFIEKSKVTQAYVYFNNSFFAKRSDYCTIAGNKINSAAFCDAVEFANFLL